MNYLKKLDIIIYPLSPLLFGIPQVLQSIKTNGLGLSTTAWSTSFILGIYYTYSSFKNQQWGLFINMVFWMCIYVVLIYLSI